MKTWNSYDNGDFSPITFYFVVEFMFGYTTSLDLVFIFFLCFAKVYV